MSLQQVFPGVKKEPSLLEVRNPEDVSGGFMAKYKSLAEELMGSPRLMGIVHWSLPPWDENMSYPPYP